MYVTRQLLGLEGLLLRVPLRAQFKGLGFKGLGLRVQFKGLGIKGLGFRVKGTV